MEQVGEATKTDYERLTLRIRIEIADPTIGNVASVLTAISNSYDAAIETFLDTALTEPPRLRFVESGAGSWFAIADAYDLTLWLARNWEPIATGVTSAFTAEFLRVFTKAMVRSMHPPGGIRVFRVKANDHEVVNLATDTHTNVDYSADAVDKAFADHEHLFADTDTDLRIDIEQHVMSHPRVPLASVTAWWIRS